MYYKSDMIYFSSFNEYLSITGNLGSIAATILIFLISEVRRLEVDILLIYTKKVFEKPKEIFFAKYEF